MASQTCTASRPRQIQTPPVRTYSDRTNPAVPGNAAYSSIPSNRPSTASTEDATVSTSIAPTTVTTKSTRTRISTACRTLGGRLPGRAITTPAPAPPEPLTLVIQTRQVPYLVSGRSDQRPVRHRTYATTQASDGAWVPGPKMSLKFHNIRTPRPTRSRSGRWDGVGDKHPHRRDRWAGCWTRLPPTPPHRGCQLRRKLGLCRR